MSDADPKPSSLRRSAFGLIAAFILLAPAMPQVLGVHLPIFRPWVMYSAVGLGLLDGDILVARAEGVEKLTPEAFLRLRHYPRTMRLTDRHVILDEADLNARFMAYCETDSAIRSLSFDGRMSWLDGWRPLSASVECPR